jgi:hypothetical protein
MDFGTPFESNGTQPARGILPDDVAAGVDATIIATPLRWRHSTRQALMGGVVSVITKGFKRFDGKGSGIMRTECVKFLPIANRDMIDSGRNFRHCRVRIWKVTNLLTMR